MPYSEQAHQRQYQRAWVWADCGMGKTAMQGPSGARSDGPCFVPVQPYRTTTRASTQRPRA